MKVVLNSEIYYKLLGHLIINTNFVLYHIYTYIVKYVRFIFGFITVKRIYVC